MSTTFRKPRSSAAKDWVLEEAIRLNEFDPTATSHYGDVSAVIMQNLPPWAEFIRTPSLEVALMGDWEDKIDKIAYETAKVDVAHIAGVPTWTVFAHPAQSWRCKRKITILEVWPNLEVFFHVRFLLPRTKPLSSLIPGDQMNYWETYNASEVSLVSRTGKIPMSSC